MVNGGFAIAILDYRRVVFFLGVAYKNQVYCSDWDVHGMFMSGKNRSTMPGMPSQSRETICGLFSIILSIPSGSFLKYGYNSKWLDHSFHIETSTVTIWGMPSWPVDTMGYHGILLMIQQLRYSGVFFPKIPGQPDEGMEMDGNLKCWLMFLIHWLAVSRHKIWM